MKYVILVAILLAGCAEPQAAEAPETPDAPEPDTTEFGPATISIELETQNETVPLLISLTTPSTVTVEAPEFFHTATASGHHSVDVPLQHGNNAVRILVDNGQSTQEELQTVTRLSQATMLVDFNHPGYTNKEETIWFNVDGNYSASAYGTMAHPDYGTVHDFMVEWAAQTGTDIQYEFHDTLGYSVSSIDGLGSPLSEAGSYWTYRVNGESAGMGISAQPILPGDHIAWCVGTCQ